MSLENVRELRKNATDCERLLWLHLRAHRLQGFKFKRQQPIGAYIVDFVCFETRCIVEADGGQHSEQIECNYSHPLYESGLSLALHDKLSSCKHPP